MSEHNTLTYARVNDDVIRMLDKPTFKWWALFIPTLIFVGFGLILFYLPGLYRFRCGRV